MSRSRWSTTTLVGAAVLSLSACGQGADGATAGLTWDDLSGRAFVSTDVLKGGDPYPLVKGSVIRLSFTGDAISASGGCNTMGGSAHLDGDVLVVDGPLSTTEMGCAEPLMSQDTWLSTLLTSKPVLALDSDQLTLANDTFTVQMLDEKTANPDRALEGTRWTVTGLVSGSGDTGTVSSVPQGVTAWLQLVDGRLTGSDACNGLVGRYVVTGDTVTVSRLVLSAKACGGPTGEVESHVLSVLEHPMTYAIDGNQLSLATSDSGLSLSAE